MRRLMTFLTGMVVGAALLFGAQRYHVIRADDGFHCVRKIESKLAATYVDIRGFSVADWAEHTDVAAALVNADKRDLMENAAGNALRQGLDNLLDGRP